RGASQATEGPGPPQPPAPTGEAPAPHAPASPSASCRTSRVLVPGVTRHTLLTRREPVAALHRLTADPPVALRTGVDSGTCAPSLCNHRGSSLDSVSETSCQLAERCLGRSARRSRIALPVS